MTANYFDLWRKLGLAVGLACLFGLLASVSLIPPAVAAPSALCPPSDPPLSGPGVFTLTGIVQDQNESPVECVQVSAYSSTADRDAYSTSSGHFTLTLQAGRYDLTFHPPLESGLASISKRGLQGSQFLPVVLPPGMLISGTVSRYDNGLPVAAVNIFAFSDDTHSGFGLHATNAAGGYQASLAEGVWKLTFTPPSFMGLGPVQKTITLTHPISGDIILGPGFTLYGHVITGSGASVANVEIFARDFAQPFGYGFGATNQAGYYEGTLPAGSYNVQFFASPFLNLGSVVTTNQVGPPDKNLTVPLPFGHTVSGTIKCRNDSGVVANAFVSAAPQGKPFLAGQFGDWGRFADESGYYAIALQPDTYHFKFVPPLGSDLELGVISDVVVAQDMTLDFEYDCLAEASYAKVIDEKGEAVQGAQIYWSGERAFDAFKHLPGTNQAGVLVLDGQIEDGFADVQPGDTLIVLLPLHNQPTSRAGHGGLAYRVYKTSLPVGAAGLITPYTVISPTGAQTLTVHTDNSLVVFNLLVSIEWDATGDYIQDVVSAIDKAADFLYDASDGQMTFGQVAIYDNAQFWAEADIQISAKNVMQPHAHINGLRDSDKSHLIRVGRHWDGNSGNQGDWSEANGFKTLAHEFGHYGLGLYDEYFGYELLPGGDLGGRRNAYCTGPENRNPATEATNASIMDYHYTGSELADRSRWTPDCTQTVQHQLNNGEADWETLLRLYSDTEEPVRWRVVTPDERAGATQAVPGPAALPADLPFPTITYTNVGPSPQPLTVTVCYNGQPYGTGAWVTLNSQGKAIDQGQSDEAGSLVILGADEPDQLRAVSLDGALSGATLIPPGKRIELRPDNARRGAGSGPYLRLWPTADQAGSPDGIQLIVSHTYPGDTLFYVLTGPSDDSIGPANAIPYDLAQGDHRVPVSYVPPARAGQARVLGDHANQFINMNVDYRLQQANVVSDTTLFSNDGHFKLHLTPGSLPVSAATFLIASPYGLPGPLPTGWGIVGEAYELTASGAITGFERPALLRLSYDPAGASGFLTGTLAIHRWDFASGAWNFIGGAHDLERAEVAATTSRLGLYALLGRPDEGSRRFAPWPKDGPGNPCLPYANTPLPDDGAMDVPLDVTLAWSSGDLEGDVAYTVAFGASEQPPVVTTTRATAFTPTNLLPDTTYYWSVTASNGAASIPGPLWRFRTVAALRYLYLPVVMR